MKTDFLLTHPIAHELYGAVQQLPIIDFHNHLDVNDLFKNRKFETITELWIASDPYKHRAMRILGVDEAKITGKETSDREKFRTWAAVLPKLLGNPLYHWSELELGGVFGIHDALTPENADVIYEQINEMLSDESFYARNLLNTFNVEYMAPCVVVNEDLEKFSPFTHIVPSLRGDDFIAPTADFARQCGDSATLCAYKAHLVARFDVLSASGGRVADHALDDGFHYVNDANLAEQAFVKVVAGDILSDVERVALSSNLLKFAAQEYAKRGWMMQLHIGALRNTNSRLRRTCGPAGGYAGIAGQCDVTSVVRLLDDLDGEGLLPQTILFTLNPSHRVPLAVLSGSFPRVQLGPAWWYCDHIYGIEEVLDTIANYGVLSTFIGMTTDSRSLLSFVRHDYFRRALAAWLSEKIQKDLMPNNLDAVKGLMVDLSYANAKTLVTGK